MADDLGKLLIRAEYLRDGVLTPQDARAWSRERMEALEALGVIASDGHAEEIVYDGCEHDCTVVNSGFHRHPDDPARSICVHRCLNGCGRVILEARDFQQWRFSLLGLAEAVRSAIGASGEVIEDVPGRVVLVGTASVAGSVAEVFLGYGLARSDAAAVVASATRLTAAEHPAVLSVGVKPGNIWSVGQRPMTAVLAEHASLGSGGLVLDLTTVFPATGLVEVKPDAWITVTKAAKQLLDDVSGINLGKAKARVSKAAGEGRFRTNGKEGQARRIEQDSFSTWRLEQRAKEDEKWDRMHL
ncbi:MAG: hypothetical protein KIT24_11645 [Phycisphaeraceae bacterium]|nr:hypothetical protein [Phycisphaeraceae bacterium]